MSVDKYKEAKENDSKYVFHSWSAQAQIDPLVIAGAQGSYFWDSNNNKYLDFSSQLVNANLGHQHPKLIAAMHKQIDSLTNIAPGFAHEIRSKAAKSIIDVAPKGFSKVFFTNGGADANEHAIRMAREFTGRSKVLAAYRSYHGATNGAIALTGEPRRWAAETPNSVVHFWGPYPYRSSFYADCHVQETERALKHLEDVIMVEGPENIAAIILETVVGTNGVLVPPPGYLPGVRKLCDKYGIVMVSDEVMTGFGRCGKWFAVENWNVVPDLITFAKGVNSGYVPLGGVIINEPIAKHFDDKAYPGGLTYSGHLLACASAHASIEILKEEKVIQNAHKLGKEVIQPFLAYLMGRHKNIGDVRGRGLLWAIEFVKDKGTREPIVPFNAKGEQAKPMLKFAALCKEKGLWPFVHFNRTHIAPPLNIKKEDLLKGLDILDEVIGKSFK